MNKYVSFVSIEWLLRREGGNFDTNYLQTYIKDESMVTYKQDKNALTYFYPKRKVLADRRTTVPLDI